MEVKLRRKQRKPVPYALYGKVIGRGSLSAMQFVCLGGGTWHGTQRDAMGRSCLADGLMGEGAAAATVPHDIDGRWEVVLRGGGGMRTRKGCCEVRAGGVRTGKADVAGRALLRGVWMLVPGSDVRTLAIPHKLL